MSRQLPPPSTNPPARASAEAPPHLTLWTRLFTARLVCDFCLDLEDAADLAFGRDVAFVGFDVLELNGHF